MAAFPELMAPRLPPVLDTVALVLSQAHTNADLRPEAQLGLEVVQLQLAHNPSILLPRVPSILVDINTLLTPDPEPFSLLELLTVLAHLLDGCCDTDHFAVPASVLLSALASHSINTDVGFWKQVISKLIDFAFKHETQSAALSVLEALGHFNRHYLPPTIARDIRTTVLPVLLQLQLYTTHGSNVTPTNAIRLGACIPNSEWQVVRATSGYVPGLTQAELDKIFLALEHLVKQLQVQTLIMLIDA